MADDAGIEETARVDDDPVVSREVREFKKAAA